MKALNRKRQRRDTISWIILTKITANIPESSELLTQYIFWKNGSEACKICELKTKSQTYNFRVELRNPANYQALSLPESTDHSYSYFIPDKKWTICPNESEQPLLYFHIQEENRKQACLASDQNRKLNVLCAYLDSRIKSWGCTLIQLRTT